MIISDDVIISEAIRLVDCGISVTFPVRGRSMLPFIVGGKESVILSKPFKIKVGDVVLAFVEGDHYVVHRVIRVAGENLTLMGDGNLALREHCSVRDVKAVATHVVSSSGVKRSLKASGRRFAAKLWVKFLPIRRLLLKIYSIVS